MRNLGEMTEAKHPFAILVNKFYGINGVVRVKRDITEYTLAIKNELQSSQPSYTGI
jgi:hypothetical protein